MSGVAENPAVAAPADKLAIAAQHADDVTPRPADLSSFVDNFSNARTPKGPSRGSSGAPKKRFLRAVLIEEGGEGDRIERVLRAATSLSVLGGNASSETSRDDSPVPAVIPPIEEPSLSPKAVVTGDPPPSSSVASRKKSKKKGEKGGARTFPEKLMEILSREDLSHAISWLPHGKSFVIPCPKKFTLEVLPLFFQRSEFSSFTRKLYYWGFRKVAKGQDVDSFQHDLFQRGNLELCKQMRAGRVVAEGEAVRGRSPKTDLKASPTKKVKLNQQESIERSPGESSSSRNRRGAGGSSGTHVPALHGLLNGHNASADVIADAAVMMTELTKIRRQQQQQRQQQQALLAAAVAVEQQNTILARAAQLEQAMLIEASLRQREEVFVQQQLQQQASQLRLERDLQSTLLGPSVRHPLPPRGFDFGSNSNDLSFLRRFPM